MKRSVLRGPPPSLWQQLESFCSGLMKRGGGRERRGWGGGGGGGEEVLDEGVKRPAERRDRKENMEPEMLVELRRLEGAADVEGGVGKRDKREDEPTEGGG